MCGIAGLLNALPAAEREARVKAMTRALVHRGPDDQGQYNDAQISLGFRRLAVIDLATGQQPICLEDRRAVIVLNGEIYNFRDLRRQLEPRHVFRSQGDVEVVLRLYAEEGISCVERLNGMFALAIWDRDQQTLYLARDRFGIKPLYYCQHGDGLAFASELRSLLAGGFPPQPTLEATQLRHFLAQGYMAPSGTPLVGVSSLAPATVLATDRDGQQRSFCYWEPPDQVGSAVPAKEVLSELAARLGRAAKDQLVADVPVGVFLSGGLDSATLSTLCRQAAKGPIQTFSVGFDEREAVSELPAARQVARLLASDHHEMVMDANQVARDLPAILASLDLPLADATVIPTWYMSRLARETVTVALSGEGADEIFGGYPRQRFDVALDRLGRCGRWLVPAAMKLAGRRLSSRLAKRLRMAPGLARQLDWSRVFTAPEIDALTLGLLPPEQALDELYPKLGQRWLALARHDPVNGRLATDRETFLPGDLLPKVDQMSMAHSLEVRVPYLDNNVVDFVLPLAGSFKQSLRRDKIILRRFAATVLPHLTAGRRKQGFDVPIGAWLRGPLRELMSDFLAPETLRQRGLFEPRSVQQMMAQHLSQERDHGRCLWTLLVFEAWLQGNFGPGGPALPAAGRGAER